MDKLETDAKDVLNQLGQLSSLLTCQDISESVDSCFNRPLEIMTKTMSFDVGVLYKITNAVENRLLLKVIKTFDPEGHRSDLVEGRRIQLDTDHPDPGFINEVLSFKSRTVSSINVPGAGCDMMGFVYVPENMGGGYLFGGDFCGKEAALRDYEISVCEIMCNFISTLLIKTAFESLATSDSLTGLYNSRKIKEEIGRLCLKLERAKKAKCVIAMCDIDHFKQINDTYGHIQGDSVLRELGKLFSSSMREYIDVAGRYGGEEFILIFDDTDLKTSFDIVERLRKTIEQHLFTRTDTAGRALKDEHLTITLSFGIAEQRSGQAPYDVKEWVGRADTALYESKKNGRNRTTLWTPTLRNTP